jgi:hypothetical protein
MHARQFSSPGLGMMHPVSQIICGSPGQSGVGAVTRGCRLSALAGLGRPKTAQASELSPAPQGWRAQVQLRTDFNEDRDTCAGWGVQSRHMGLHQNPAMNDVMRGEADDSTRVPLR